MGHPIARWLSRLAFSLALGDAEGLPGVEASVSDSLAHSDPPLVARLDSQDVQVALADGGGDQLVPAALVAVDGSDQKLVLVVGLSVRVLSRGGAEDGGGRGGVGLEASLGLGLDLGAGLSENVSDAIEEFGRGLVRDASLAALLDENLQVVHVVEAVDVPEIDSGVGPLLGWAPVGWEGDLVAVAEVVRGSREVSGLSSEDVGGLAVGGEGWSRPQQRERQGERAEESASLHLGFWPLPGARADPHASPGGRAGAPEGLRRSLPRNLSIRLNHRRVCVSWSCARAFVCCVCLGVLVSVSSRLLGLEKLLFAPR